MAYKRKPTELPTVHRVVTIRWRPRTDAEWKTFTESRCEAAELWQRMCRIHAFCRRRQRSWPTKQQLRDWSSTRRGHFPNLNSQSRQLAVDEFLEAVKATSEKRKKARAAGRKVDDVRYPTAKGCRYRDVAYKNNQVRIRGGSLVLPNSKAGDLFIAMPSGIEATQSGSTDIYVQVGDKYVGRLMEVQLGFDELRLIIAVQVQPQEQTESPVIGVDLGVNTLIAATDGEKAILISGRGVKSLVRYRNKKLGEITRKQTMKRQGLAKTKGSRSWRKLQRAKKRMLGRNKRQINDLIHKATRQVTNAFPGAAAYVGKPFNDAARKCDRKRAQTVSSACNRKIIENLSYKLKEVKEVEEHYTSQTCPNCGERKKCKRVYRCTCGFVAPRDVAGAVNILSKGQTGLIVTGVAAPVDVTYSRPGATRNCDRADIHGLRHPLGDVADVRVEEAQEREQSQTGASLQSPVTPCAIPSDDSAR